MVTGDVLGVAQLCNKKTGQHFTEFDEDLASAFAVYCCISISHVSLKACFLPNGVPLCMRIFIRPSLDTVFKINSEYTVYLTSIQNSKSSKDKGEGSINKIKI